MTTKNNVYKIVSIVFLAYWLFLVAFILADLSGALGPDIGLSESLRTSGLARGMFMDIGGLSMLVSLWIVTQTRYKIRWVIGILTLFVGSFAALPYVSWWLWHSQATHSIYPPFSE